MRITTNMDAEFGCSHEGFPQMLLKEKAGNSIRRALGLISMLISLLVISQVVDARSSVWRVTDGKQQMYVGGTVHLLRAEDLPLPPEFDMAYQLSDSLVFETDIGTIEDPSNQGYLMQLMLAGPGKQVDEVLDPRTYSRLLLTFGRYGLNLQDLRPFKVAMMVMALTVAELDTLGVNRQGVDQLFYQKGHKDGKRVMALESVQEQIQFLASMGDGYEESFVSMSLDELEHTKSAFFPMLEAWRAGDEAKLAELFLAEMSAFPHLYNKLLVERNANWMPTLTSLLEKPGVELVLVGAAHLIGPDGLLTQLRTLGYQVEQLEYDDNAVIQPGDWFNDDSVLKTLE
jgi:uncharacterized protein YbaP (TraB family)